ncbi:zinc finger domain-containing protein [Sphaerisporangium album]|uniref:zinc finger domain-containing protein n=1 Tax=Sphaerisporangium album TaxID=509200 RepID=UPI0011C03AA4|nr:hypothetical protein [Sphaerisporangium album]
MSKRKPTKRERKAALAKQRARNDAEYRRQLGVGRAGELPKAIGTAESAGAARGGRGAGTRKAAPYHQPGMRVKRLRVQVRVTVAEVHGVRCPRCLARPGQFCREGSGAEIPDGHGARWRSARRAAARYEAEQAAARGGGRAHGRRRVDRPEATPEPEQQVAVGRRDPVNAAFAALREGQRQRAF